MDGEPSPEDQVTPPASARPFFNPWATVLWVLLVAFLIGLFVAYVSGRPLERLERPEESLARIVAREMDLRAALREAPRWERTLEYALLPSDAEALEDAIAWYDELARTLDSPLAETYRLVLLGEAGRTDAIGAALATRSVEEASWVRVAYLGAPFEPDARATLLAGIRDSLPADWFADALHARVAARLGDASAQAAAHSAIAERGGVLLGRWRVLVETEVLVLAFAAAALCRLRPRRVGVEVGEATLPPPWSMADGFGLFVRGAGAYLIILMLLFGLPPLQLGAEVWSSVAASLPFVWWTARLLKARGAAPLPALGLSVKPGRAARLAGVTIVLLGLSALVDLALAVLAGGLRVTSHWTEGFREVTLWGGPWLVTVDAVDAIVLAPLVEELAFRGILYPTLRARLAAWPAAMLSGGLFALLHGYGLMGFAAVFSSGVLWALAYERTRSVLPGLLAHAAGNLVTTASVVWLLRL